MKNLFHGSYSNKPNLTDAWLWKLSQKQTKEMHLALYKKLFKSRHERKENEASFIHSNAKVRREKPVKHHERNYKTISGKSKTKNLKAANRKKKKKELKYQKLRTWREKTKMQAILQLTKPQKQRKRLHVKDIKKQMETENRVRTLTNRLYTFNTKHLPQQTSRPWRKSQPKENDLHIYI